MLESLQSDNRGDAAHDPADTLLRRMAADSAIRWYVPPAGNDPVCEPVVESAASHAGADAAAHARVAEAPQARETLDAGLGHFATTEPPLLDCSVTYEVYRIARVRRARMQALLMRRAVAFARRRVRALWTHYRRHREMRAIHDALCALDDRTLRDLGFHRCEISSVAAEVTGVAECTRMLPRAPS